MREAGLPAEEVLDKATHANRDLQAVHFKASATFDLPQTGGLHGTFQADGRTQQAGKQVQFTFQGAGETPGSTGEASPWQIDGELIVANEQEVYVQIRSFTGGPASLPPIMFAPFLNRWWKLPPKGAAPSTGVTPNPELLKMQSAVVDVTRDHGLTTFNGRRSYHYDVSLNRDKLVQFLEQVAVERKEQPQTEEWRKAAEKLDAEGELWIDAETFYVQGLRWTLSSSEASMPYEVQMQFDLSDHNAVNPIQPPADAELLPANPLEVLPGGLTPPSGF